MARQADACHFVRPFRDGFAECPAYQRVEFLAVDSQYRSLGRHNTCRHLEAKSLGGRAVGYYGACALGDAEGRRHWVDLIDERRLEGIRAVGIGLGDATREVTRELWQAKSDQLRATRAGRPAAAPERRMRRLAREYERQARAYLEANAAQLEALDLPLAACLELVAGALEFWVAQMSMEGAYQVPDPILERFPREVQLLIRPHARKAS
jgi:hypothetical protein